MKKASLLIMIVSMLSKLLGFVRQAVLADLIGKNAISDAFVYSLNLPTIIFTVIAAAFVTGFIPMFTRIENDKENGSKVANGFMNNILNTMFVVCAVLCLLFLLFTTNILNFLLPGTSSDQLFYLVPFTRVTIFSIFFTCIIQLMTGFLQIKNSFVVPALVSFPLNFTIIGGIMLYPNLGEKVLPYSILLAFLAQALLVLVAAKRKGYKYDFRLNFKDKNLKKMILVAIPLIIGTSSDMFGEMIQQGIISGVEGAITLLDYTTTTGSMVYSIFGLAIVSVMYPKVSKMISQNDIIGAQKEFGDSFVSLLLFMLPSMIGLIVLAKPILRLIYVRGGKFTEADLMVLIPVFIGYAAGITAVASKQLLVRVYYSFQDMKTPMWNSLVMLILQYILGTMFFKMWGIAGVTWSMTVVMTLSVLHLLFKLKIHFKTNHLKKYMFEIVKLLVAAISMGVIVHIVYVRFQNFAGELVSLLSAIFFGVITFSFLVILSKVKIVFSFCEQLKAKIRK